MKTFHFLLPTPGEGRFIKQSGPLCRFGHVVLVVESVNEAALEVRWQVPESSIPLQFQLAVSRGVRRLFEPGAKYAEFSSASLLVRVVGGTFHPTDSNEVSYELAASAAFVNAINSGASAADT